jgi:hypothetical protein
LVFQFEQVLEKSRQSLEELTFLRARHGFQFLSQIVPVKLGVLLLSKQRGLFKKPRVKIIVYPDWLCASHVSDIVHRCNLAARWYSRVLLYLNRGAVSRATPADTQPKRGSQCESRTPHQRSRPSNAILKTASAISGARSASSRR